MISAHKQTAYDAAIEQYNHYVSNKNDVWASRLTWSKGKDPKHTISLMNFFKADNSYKELFADCKETNDVINAANGLADKYVTWVRSNNPKTYSESDFEDMHNFVVGAIGELFFYLLLTEVKCMISPDNDDTRNISRYDFNCVYPNMQKDFGIDLLGIVNDTPCAIQVKFWNPFSKPKYDMAIYQKVYADGVINGIINAEDNKNIVLCCLSDENDALRCVSSNKPYLNKIVCVGWHTLNYSVNNRNKFFWNKLRETLDWISTI